MPSSSSPSSISKSKNDPDLEKKIDAVLDFVPPRTNRPSKKHAVLGYRE